MGERFLPFSLEHLVIGEPLPGDLYVSIDSRHVIFRATGDSIGQLTYDRLQFKQINSLFIREEDRSKFEQWSRQFPRSSDGPILTPSGENEEFLSAWRQTHRKTLDIFQTQHPDQQVAGVIQASKQLVAEVMKNPFAIQSLSQLQTFSRGTVDHSVNVAILSVYLAMQMGYRHTVILQHVGAGGVLHDIGKRKIDLLDSDSTQTMEAKMREHPTMGVRLLEGLDKVPNEVKLIVGQHHEYHDGTGYPNKLRGSAIYDLARIVCIANTFDDLVSKGKGTLLERQRAAVSIFDQKYFTKVDPDKHEKAVRILKLGV